MNASIETLKREIKHLPPVARKRAERALGIAQPENEHRVFVYGTLLTGEGNANWARGARRTPAWATGTIHDTGYGYPAFVRGGETRIRGELLTVDDEGFKSMDRLEGYPRLYRREEIAAKARAVIQKNVYTVQQVARLFGEHIAETEVMLKEIAGAYESHTVGKRLREGDSGKYLNG